MTDSESLVVRDANEIDRIGRAPVLAWKEGMTIDIGTFYAGMPNDVYHSTPHASSSKLSRIARSPAHARYEKQMVQTTDMRIGSAIHAAVLEPDVFERDYVLLADVEDRRRSEYKEAAKHHNPEFIILGDEAAHIAGVQATLLADPNIGPLLDASKWREISGFTQCPDTGALCKFRMDSLITELNGEPRLIGIDLKTTVDASPEEFSKTVDKFRYHAQMAFYADQFFWLTGLPLDAWAYIVVEKKPPYGAKIYTLEDEAIVFGRHLYRRDLATWKRCNETGVWPAYDSKPEVIGLPAWAIKRHRDAFALEILTEQNTNE